MKSNKGFTLIEMLAVIIIMTIIMGIGIPSVIRIIQNKSSDLYNVQEKLAEKGTDLYTSRYKAKFKSFEDQQCFILEYQKLLEEDLLTEQDLNCSGDIKLVRKGKNSYKKSFYLTCADKSNNIVKTSDPISAQDEHDCIRISTATPQINPDMPVPTIKACLSGTSGANCQEPTDWISTSAVITLDGTPITGNTYQYYQSTNPQVPSNGVTATTVNPTTGVTISAQGTTYVWFRTVETATNKVSGWSNRVAISIDKQVPSQTVITSDDNIASGAAHTENFVLTFNVTSNNPAGVYYMVGTAANNMQRIDYDFQEVNLETTATNTIYYVKACNKVTNQCYATPTQYKVVK